MHPDKKILSSNYTLELPSRIVKLILNFKKSHQIAKNPRKIFENQKSKKFNHSKVRMYKKSKYGKITLWFRMLYYVNNALSDVKNCNNYHFITA